jgi:hypothetical protein
MMALLSTASCVLLAHRATLAAPSQHNAGASSATATVDPDLSYIRQHAATLVAELQIDGHFARAADAGRPRNYTAPRARDLAFLVHGAGDVLGGAASALAVADGLDLLHDRASGAVR